MKKSLVLVGGGHAHLFVLHALAKKVHADMDVVLISPEPLQYYSGMLPGWMAGHYALEECRIDLIPLLNAANVTFIQETVIGMDADKRFVCLSDGRHVHYDVLSLDVGSETQVDWLAELGDKLMPVKPLHAFARAWTEVLRTAAHAPAFHLAVVGAGAAGVEVALCAARFLRSRQPNVRVSVLAGERGLLAGHSSAVVSLVGRILKRSGVDVLPLRAVGSAAGLLLSNGETLVVDKVIAATGASAPVWLKLGKLQLNPQGFIAVNAHHQSDSHAQVFAAGDVCARSDVAMARSGVHAVKAGPVLAHNLVAFLRGQALRKYRPRRHSLYLLADGSRHAILSWGPLAASGPWFWRWKHAIDKRFVARFSFTEPTP